MCLALGLLVAWILLFPQRNAGFWDRDDHEFIALFTGTVPIEFERVQSADRIAFVTPKLYRLPLNGPDNTLTFAGIPAELAHTEVVSPGLVGRFRPVYYLLRAVEVSLWGDDVGAYYIVRTVMFGIVLAGILWVGWMAIGPLGAAILGLFALDYQMWGDLWCKLGPSEQYASVGMAFFLVGMAYPLRNIARGDQARWSGPTVLLSLGLILAAGSKENFVFMAVPVFLIAAYGLYRRQLSYAAATFAVLALGFACFIALAVASSMGRLGSDVYGNSVSVSDRFQTLRSFLQQFGSGARFDLHPMLGSTVDMLGIVAGCAVLALSLWVIYRRQRTSPDPSLLRQLGVTSAINLLAGLWVVWEIVFYHGVWPTGGRYDFPGMLIFLVLLGSGLALIAGAIGPGRRRAGAAWLSLAVALIVQAKVYGFDFRVRQAAIENAQRTQQFMHDIQALAQISAAHPDWPLYVQATRFPDFELSLSLRKWLIWQHVSNPQFLRMASPLAELAGNPFRQALWTTMEQTSIQGAFGFEPIASLDPDQEAAGHCIAVISINPGIVRQPVDSPCVPAYLHWY